MSGVSGAIAVPVPLSVTNKGKGERTGAGLRFTPLLSRETWVAIAKKRDEMRTYSAICFPGWDRG
jgi:hypothetical protein